MEPGSGDPLRVDWLDATELNDGAPGRLGMTSLPGKQGHSARYPGRVYRRELGRDLETLRASGIRHLLLLVEDDELSRWGDPEIVRHGADRGVIVSRRPLPDGSAPRSAQEMDETLSVLATARRAADVAVACMGGVGRTGTVAACALVAAGHSARGAIERVRELRHPTAVETQEQVAFVHAYERHVAARRNASGKVAP